MYWEVLLKMKSYYDENYQAFINKHQKCDYIAEENDECSVVLYTDTKGMDVFAIREAEYDRLIGSAYDNQYFINKWVEETTVASNKSVIFVYGLGDYRCIKALAEKFPENDIIVYEPRVEYLKSIMEVYDITDLINDEKIEILAGKGGLKFMIGMCGNKVNVSNAKYSQYRLMPQYEQLYPQELSEWEYTIRENIKTIIIDKEFNLALGKEVEANVLANTYKAVLSCSIIDAINDIKEKKNDTAILVSAGPSLAKNIHLLKEAKNKAFIIVVDTAVKPVLKAGVRPDLIVTIDPTKPEELFMYQDKLVDIPMVTILKASGNIINKYKGKLFFSYDWDLFFDRLYDKDDYVSICLDTAGSVANNAMSFLLKCNFKNIILIGQDLAYSNNKTHVSGAFDSEDKIEIKEGGKYIEIKDIYGNTVTTGLDMDHYRVWFENIIKASPEYNIIDATEGGALIEGSKLMTFAEAIDKYIKDLPEVNYEQTISSIKEPSEEEIEKKINKIYNFDKEILETKQDIKDTLKLYDELDAINRKGNYASKRLKTLVEDIGAKTDEIKKSVLGTIVLYTVGNEEYEVIENINENKQSVYDEFKMIIDSGRKMLNKQYDEADEVLEKIQNMIADIREREEKRKA